MTKNMSVDGKRGRGRPKKIWFEVIQCDMRMTNSWERRRRKRRRRCILILYKV